FCYIDDILVASKNEDEHFRHLRTVFERLQKYGLVVNSSKCVFGSSTVDFLGHRVSSNGIAPLPEKIDAIKNFPRPETRSALRRFLGLVNFFRRFIPQCATVLDSLNAMLAGKAAKNAPLTWSSHANHSFARIKEALSSLTLLNHPVPGAPLALFTDASNVAVGAVLQQFHQNSWQPLGFFSRKLQGAETRYSAFGRELLAIYLAVKHSRHMVEGRPFTVYTDHKPITFAMTTSLERHSPCEARHLDFISSFTTDIQHVSGANNVVADALSRPTIN